MLKATQLLCAAVLLVSQVGCAATPAAAARSAATGYRVVICDSLTDLTHANFELLAELHLPAEGISFNRFDDEAHAFYTTLSDRRATRNAAGREQARLRAEASQQSCDISVSARLIDRLRSLAELNRATKALRAELGGDEELQLLMGQVESELGPPPKTDLEKQIERLIPPDD